MSLSAHRYAPLLFVVLLAACGGRDAASEAAGAPGEPVSAPEAAAPTFDEDLEACALLTPEMVAELFGVGAGSLEQNDMGSYGCYYSWSDQPGTPDGDVRIMSVTVRDTPEKASSYFASLTRDLSADEVADAMDAIGDQLDREADEGEISGETAEKGRGVAGAMAGQTGEDGLQHDRYEGIGDGAAMDQGTLRVLKGNVIFGIEAILGDGTDDAADEEATLRTARAVVARMETM